MVDGVFYFASEAKALLPFLPAIETDPDGLKDYLAFQFCLAGKTLFKGVRELPPGHSAAWSPGRRRRSALLGGLLRRRLRPHRHAFRGAARGSCWTIRSALHLRADVPVGAYLSGGIDSSVVACAGGRRDQAWPDGVHGQVLRSDPRYDESPYARIVARSAGWSCTRSISASTISSSDIENVAYHLDYPVGRARVVPAVHGPAAAGEQVKVILGGQGGDEIFGGYTRYLIAYFEQCIKGAIDGTLRDGNYVVTYESIIPNLVALRNYKPLMADFWSEGLFEDLDAATSAHQPGPRRRQRGRRQALGDYSPFETFREIFNGDNVGHEAYFDKMTHFDFKTLLPALLQVEDRVSMAHGLESRVPLLDHRLIELAATIPADVKFKHGHMKHAFKRATANDRPDSGPRPHRQDGLPRAAVGVDGGRRTRVRHRRTLLGRSQGARADRQRQGPRGAGERARSAARCWGLLSLELWQRAFHDRGATSRLRDPKRTEIR